MDRVALWLGVLCASVFLLLQEGAITGSDGASMYQVTRSIVEQRDLSIDDAGLGVPGRGGEAYSKYGIGQPLVSLVPYAIAWPVARAASARADRIEQAAVSSLVPLVSALLIVALYSLARRLGARAAPAGFVAAGSIAGTFLLPYSKEFFSEPLAALGITVAIERALAGRAGWSGAALGLACLTRPQTFVLAPVLLLVAWRRGGVRSVARATAPVAAALGLALAYNAARFADLLEFGYGSEPGFTTPVWRGAWGLLFDPRESVLLFAPLVVLVVPALMRLRDRDALALIGGNLVITLVMSAAWWSWAGGWSWGPRLLIPGITPALAAIAPWAQDRRPRLLATGALLALGLAVSAPALLVSTRAQQLEASPTTVGPSVARQYELLPTVARHTVSNIDERAEGDHRRFLSLWQVGTAAELGAKGAALAAAGSMGLLAITGWSGTRLRRALRGAGDQIGGSRM